MSYSAQQQMYLQQLGITVYRPRLRVEAAIDTSSSEYSSKQAAAVQTPLAHASAFRQGLAALSDAPETERDSPTASPGTLGFVSRAQAAELVVPSADLKRFIASKLSLHLALALCGRVLPIVENAVQSETALWLDSPDGALKLSSQSLLRSNWRSKRQIWLAIRLWRKRGLAAG